MAEVKTGSIVTTKKIRCNVKSLKPLTYMPGTMVKPLCGIMRTWLADTVRDHYLLRVFNRWSLLSLFFMDENQSGEARTLVNHIHKLSPEIVFNILAKTEKAKSEKDDKGYYSFNVVNRKFNTDVYGKALAEILEKVEPATLIKVGGSYYRTNKNARYDVIHSREGGIASGGTGSNIKGSFISGGSELSERAYDYRISSAEKVRLGYIESSKVFNGISSKESKTVYPSSLRYIEGVWKLYEGFYTGEFDYRKNDSLAYIPPEIEEFSTGMQVNGDDAEGIAGIFEAVEASEWKAAALDHAETRGTPADGTDALRHVGNRSEYYRRDYGGKIYNSLGRQIIEKVNSLTNNIFIGRSGGRYFLKDAYFGMLRGNIAYTIASKAYIDERQMAGRLEPSVRYGSIGNIEIKESEESEVSEESKKSKKSKKNIGTLQGKLIDRKNKAAVVGRNALYTIEKEIAGDSIYLEDEEKQGKIFAAGSGRQQPNAALTYINESERLSFFEKPEIIEQVNNKNEYIRRERYYQGVSVYGDSIYRSLGRQIAGKISTAIVNIFTSRPAGTYYRKDVSFFNHLEAGALYKVLNSFSNKVKAESNEGFGHKDEKAILPGSVSHSKAVRELGRRAAPTAFKDESMVGQEYSESSAELKGSEGERILSSELIHIKDSETVPGRLKEAGRPINKSTDLYNWSGAVYNTIGNWIVEKVSNITTSILTGSKDIAGKSWDAKNGAAAESARSLNMEGANSFKDATLILGHSGCIENSDAFPQRAGYNDIEYYKPEFTSIAYSGRNTGYAGYTALQKGHASAANIYPKAWVNPGSRLVEKLLQNVMHTFKQNHMERYIAAKEIFEKAIEKNPFLARTNTQGYAQGGYAQGHANVGYAQGHGINLLNSFSSFKSELEHLKNIYLRGASLIPGYNEGTAGEAGYYEGAAGKPAYDERAARKLRYYEGAVGKPAYDERAAREPGYYEGAASKAGYDGRIAWLPEYGDVTIGKANTAKCFPVLYGLNAKASGVANAVLSHMVAGKRIIERHRDEYNEIVKLACENRTKGIQTIAANNVSQEAIMKRRETNQTELKLLQNNSHTVLAGSVPRREMPGGAAEMIILAPPVIAQDNMSGYAKSMPPITYKEEEKASKKQSEKLETVVKSLNTPVDYQEKSIKHTISDVDLMNPTELNKLVDRVYSQLETRLSRERRRFGF